MTDTSGSLLGQGLTSSAQLDTQRQSAARGPSRGDSEAVSFSFRGQELSQEEAELLFGPYLQTLLQDGKWLPPAANLAATGTQLPATATAQVAAPIVASLTINQNAIASTPRVTDGQELLASTTEAEADANPVLRPFSLHSAVEGKSLEGGEKASSLRLSSEVVDPVLGQRESIRQSVTEIKTSLFNESSHGLALSQSLVTGTTTGLAGQQQATAYIGPSVQHADWGNAFASRVAWQIGEGVQQAKILVNPPELGPIEIRVSVDKDATSVQFLASQGMTREAIEEAIPRLRELLQQSGLQLGDASVSAGDRGDAGAADQGQYGDSDNQQGSRATLPGEVVEEQEHAAVVTEHHGLVNERV